MHHMSTSYVVPTPSVDVPKFPQRILFSDEVYFTSDGVFNSQTSYIWDKENPRTTHSYGFQQWFGINVWAGIIDGHMIELYILLYPVMVQTSLQEELVEFLEDVPLNIRKQLWLQYDDAPAHFSLAI